MEIAAPGPQVTAGFVDIIEAVRGTDTAPSRFWVPGLQPRPQLIDTAVSWYGVETVPSLENGWQHPV